MPEFFCYDMDDYTGAREHGRRQATSILADSAEQAAMAFAKPLFDAQEVEEDGDAACIEVKDGETWKCFEVQICIDVDFDITEVTSLQEGE